jgi:hypothetical protein
MSKKPAFSIEKEQPFLSVYPVSVCVSLLDKIKDWNLQHRAKYVNGPNPGLFYFFSPGNNHLKCSIKPKRREERIRKIVFALLSPST